MSDLLIVAYFTLNGSPKTGLSATVRMRDLSDNSLVVTDTAMTEVGDGFYKYTYSSFDNTKDYTIRCDGSATLQGNERYAVATTNGLGDIEAILVDTGTTIPALIAALHNLSASEVNAEMLDVLQTDTFAEPSSVPAATASIIAKINWLTALARNKLIQNKDTGTLVARNDGDTANIGSASVSDDGTTATRNKFT